MLGGRFDSGEPGATTTGDLVTPPAKSYREPYGTGPAGARARGGGRQQWGWVDFCAAGYYIWGVGGRGGGGAGGGLLRAGGAGANEVACAAR